MSCFQHSKQEYAPEGRQGQADAVLEKTSGV